MSAYELLQTLQKNNIRIKLDDTGNLVIRGDKARLTPEFVKSIKLLKPEITNLLSGNAKPADIVKIEPHQKSEQLQLSYSQQRLWLLSQIEQSNAHYNMPGAFRLKGSLNMQVLQAVFDAIVARHEVLRSVIKADASGTPYQEILEQQSLPLEMLDLSALEQAAQAQAVRQQVQQEFTTGFDLAESLMLRVKLLKLSDSEHVLLTTMHHIASDGWSMGVLMREFCQLYNAFAKGESNPFLELEIQYSDYAHWQRQWLRGDVLQKQLDYWQAQLAGIPQVHSLPLDYARPKQQGFRGAMVETTIQSDTVATLKSLCQSQDATLFMGLQAAFSVLLSRYSGQTDIVTGSPVANREQSELGGLIGFFVNTLVLRSDLSDSPSFETLLQRTRDMLLQAYGHQQVPFEQIVEHLQPSRDTGYSPLFQVMLVLQNQQEMDVSLPGLALETITQETVSSKFDLTLSVHESSASLTLQWNYNTELFEQQTIAGLAKHFNQLLDALVNSPQDKVLEVEMLSEDERETLVTRARGEQKSYDLSDCVHQQFETQAALAHDATALVLENDTLSYDALNDRANRLAHYLINQCHVTPQTLVGICLSRSVDMIVSILAVLKAGGAYVPLDPAYPASRLTYMLEDAQVKTVLYASDLEESLDLSAIAQPICLNSDKVQTGIAGQQTNNPGVTVSSSNLAYIIYTSGSTGNPKGVMVEHGNLTRLFQSTSEAFSFGKHDTWSLFHSFAFDFSVWEIWGALCFGGKLVMVPYWVSRSPEDFYQLLSKEKVTVLNQTPSAFSGVIAEDQRRQLPLSLRYVIFGGEALNPAMLSDWVARHGDAQPELINMYGITETTVHVTYRKLKVSDINRSVGGSLIGKPLADLGAVVLDPAGHLVPTGVAGELYVFGGGVSRGYLNREALTAERFVELEVLSGERAYRTGDVARYLSTGELEYLGRIDKQVQVRGFRIEPGEIQQALLANTDASDAAVMVHSDGEQNNRLVAWVVTDDAAEGWQSQLEEQLSQVLPEHMVPRVWVVVDRLPLTVNGKVDYKALPAPDFSGQQASYVAPETDNEKLLCQIWQSLLGLDQLGVHDNFFALGGHSLLIMQVIAQLQQQQRQLPVKQFFATPTVSVLAAWLDTQEQQVEAFKAPENLITKGCTALTPDLLPLLELTQQELDLIVDQVPGGVANVQDIYPLGPLQEGILFHHLVADGADPYIVPTLLHIATKADLDGFINALNFVIQRHDILRTAILWEGLSQPVQVVYREAELPVSQLSLDASDAALSQMKAMCEPHKQSMPLTKGPLLQAVIGHVADSEDYYLLLNFHHIVSDHVALEVIQNEVFACLEGAQHSLPEPLAYREFIAHVLHQSQTHDVNRYFGDMLSDVDSPTVPFGLSGAQSNGSDIIETKAALSPSLCNAIKRQSVAMEQSPAVLFHAAWALLLSVCSRRDDVVFGTVLSGRLQGAKGAHEMPGVFINTLPLRVKTEGLNLNELLAQVKQSLQGLLNYEQAPLALVQRCSAISTDDPLFTAMLNYRHTSGEQTAAQNSNIGFIKSSERTNYPFSLIVNETPQGFSLEAQIDKSIQGEHILGYMEQALQSIVEALGAGVSAKVCDLQVLSDAEIKQLSQGLHSKAANYRVDCLHEQFDAQAAATPDAQALVFEQETLSYAQLQSRSNQLAHYLVEQGVVADMPVGIALERSIDMVVAILAVLKAGGAYVPLDPSYPQSRLGYMMDNAGLTLLLTDTQHATLASAEVRALCLNTAALKQQLAQYPVSNPAVQVSTSQLAYVIYTSGSTGQPKGVMVEHRALTNRIAWMQDEYGCGAGERILQKTPYSFDVSVWEFLWPLSTGATLVVARPGGHQEPDYLCELIRHSGVTKLHFVPSMLGIMLATEGLKDCSSLKQVFCSGEALQVNHVERFFEQCPAVELHNLYGPTEAAIDVSYWDCRGYRDGDSHIPIGRPIGNIQLYVLDSQGQPVPQGVPGELHIGGVGLARGYLNLDELTKERFIEHRFDIDAEPVRLYKTGDLARYDNEGELEYLGRIDHQVKIRGFRIETGEIEHALLSHPQVDEAVVLALPDNGDTRLVGYVVHALGDEWQASLAQHLGSQLPDYMVPAILIELDSVPLTVNGKVNRKALPAPDFSQQQSGYVAPATETEQLLCAIWQEVLGLEQIGVNDNFFALGGHSLLIMKVTALLQQQQRQLPVKQFFATPMIAPLAQWLDEQGRQGAVFEAPANLITPQCTELTPELLPLVALSQKEIDSIVQQVPGGVGNIQDIYPLGPLQEGILFHHMMGEGADPYVIPSLFRITGASEVTRFIDALNQVIQRHDILRTAILWEGLSQPVQVVCRNSEIPVNNVVIQSEQSAEDEMQRLFETSLYRMDLTKGPLLYASIGHIENSEAHYLLLTFHHIVLDHVALEVIQREMAVCYAGEQASLTEPLAYREFIAHVQHQSKSHDINGYFEQMLGDVDSPTIPFDLSGSQGDGSDIIEVKAELPVTLCEDIRAQSVLRQQSPAVLFHTAWALVLSACSGRDDVVFGTVLSGRLQGTKGAQEMPGVFINTLPLRVKTKAFTLNDLISQVKASLQGLLGYEQAPLAQVQRCSAIPADEPLFTSMINYRHEEKLDESLAPMKSIELIFSHERSNYPLGILVDEGEHLFKLNIQTRSRQIGERIREYLLQTLTSLVKGLRFGVDIDVSELQVLPKAELAQLMPELTQLASVEPCLHQIFDAQTEATPEAVALQFEQQSQSYRQLQHHSNTLAHYLVEQGVKAEVKVGIALGRSTDMVVAMLAILKAGGAFVPLDPSYPQSRLDFMISDAGLSLVITEQQYSSLVPNAVQTICFDDQAVRKTCADYPMTSPQIEVSPTDLAYIIYTSGSTGQPKGVMVEHKSLSNLVQNLKGIDFAPRDTAWALCASFSFDGSLKGICQMVVGRTMNVVSEESRRDPLNLIESLDGVGVIDCTPTTVEAWFAAGIQHQLPNLVIGGEKITKRLWQKLLTWQKNYGRKAFNVYGPTESCVNASATLIATEQPNMGGFFNNVFGYILNENGSPVAPGAEGELYLTGLGLARGYINQPELTQCKFVDNPFYAEQMPEHYRTLYKTGDLVKYTGDHKLQFISRTDKQVKLRGYRIELEEVTQAVLNSGFVKEAVSIIRQSDSDDAQLVTYVVKKAETDKVKTLLDQALQTVLPEYMHPNKIIELQEIPRTVSGKLDHKALPEADESQPATAYTAPRNALERKVCDIWQNVLQVERVGIDDNFFDLGGHSITLIKILAAINTEFGVMLNVKLVFELSDVRSLAAHIQVTNEGLNTSGPQDPQGSEETETFEL